MKKLNYITSEKTIQLHYENDVGEKRHTIVNMSTENGERFCRIKASEPFGYILNQNSVKDLEKLLNFLKNEEGKNNY